MVKVACIKRSRRVELWQIMSRVEILQRWFFPISSLRKDGVIMPAPAEAVSKYTELRDEWLKNHPDLPHEIPIVMLSPSKEQGKEGYAVRIEIEYKTRSYSEQNEV